MSCENRLIAQCIGRGRTVRDVRWQRHLAVPLEPIDERLLNIEAQTEQPIIAIDNRCRRAVGELHRRSNRRHVACPDLHPCLVSRDDPFDQPLDAAAGRLAPEETRANHARIVQHDEIGGRDQGRQIAKRQIGQRITVDMQETARRADRRRLLRDQLRWKGVVEIGEREERPTVMDRHCRQE